MATNLAFNEQFYLSQNPDVVVAIARGQFANAQAHFNQFGAAEGRDPNAFFDSSFYLTQYPDVLNARANPLDHFLNFGAAELRFANATADTAIDTDGSNFANEFDAQAYLTANPDLANAVGAGRAFENAYEHYILFGQFESRPGTPAGGPFTNTGTPVGTGDTIALTPTVGEIVNGTAANDTFTGVVGTDGTFNVGDQINGLGGNDTFNLTVADGATALPGGASVSNVETINITYAGGALAALNSSTFAGATQIWQIDNDSSADFANITVGNNVVAGFRGNVAVADSVIAAAGVTSVSVALDGVASTSAINLAETTANGLSTVTVSGSVADAANGTNALSLTTTTAGGITGAADIDTLNLNLSSDTAVTISALDDLNTLDASASTGNLEVDLGTPDELTSAEFGSGNDTVTLNTSALAAGTLAIDLGAGNDTITVTGLGNTAVTATSITLGAGSDSVEFINLTNITAANVVAGDLITITDFNAAQDVLDLSGLVNTATPTPAGIDREILTNAELATISDAATLDAALTAAATATGASAYSLFNYDGDAYLFVNDADAAFDAGDGLVRIVGFSVEQLTAQNFIA